MNALAVPYFVAGAIARDILLTRLYGDAIDALEAVDFQLDLAGALVLGRDARRMLTEDTHKRLTRFLEDRKQRERLTIAMARAWAHTEDAMLQAERLLEQFQEGLGGNRF